MNAERVKVDDEGEEFIFIAPQYICRNFDQHPCVRHYIRVMPEGVAVKAVGDEPEPARVWTLYPWHTVLFVEGDVNE